MAKRQARNESKSPPENRRKTAEASRAWSNISLQTRPERKPGRTASDSKTLGGVSRAKLASPIPGDPENRSYAEAIADKLALLALRGDIRAAQELADRAEGRPSQMAPPAEQNGVKYIVLDMPRPPRGVIMPDVGPRQLSDARPASAKI
jgi:hypothetical protein